MDIRFADRKLEKECNDDRLLQRRHGERRARLVAHKSLAHFVEAADFRVATVKSFAEQQGVAPGIVVGQLQHRRVLPFNHPLSRLKTSFRWIHETRAA